MLNISIPDSAFDDLRALPDKLKAGIQIGLDKSAEAVLDEKKRQIQSGTYDQPIPTRPKNGHPQWTRSGDWLNDQTINSPDENTYVIASVGNSAAYEARLANLPAGKDGISRSNPASERAAAAVESRITEIIEAALSEALNN